MEHFIIKNNRIASSNLILYEAVVYSFNSVISVCISEVCLVFPTGFFHHANLMFLPNTVPCLEIACSDTMWQMNKIKYKDKGVDGTFGNETNEGIVIIIRLSNYLVSILGLDLGYTVKLSPSPLENPSENPSGERLYLTVYPLSRPNTDTV